MSVERPIGNTYVTSFNHAAGGAGSAFELLGTATKTVRVLEVAIMNPSTSIDVSIKKLSAASTGGTSTAGTAIPLDASNPAATATSKLYTAAPTQGTAVGSLVDAVAVGTSGKLQWEGNRLGAQPLVLRGVAQVMAVHVSAAATVKGWVVWTEGTN